jgi:hypothetical protein
MAGNNASAQEKTVVIHGTATPGGGFPVYGAAFADTINEIETTLSVQPKNTKGSTENVPLLEAGSLDTGQVTGEVTYEAITGIGRPRANVKILSAMYSNTGMFIVRADSPYRTNADLKGKPIAWGASGSGFVVLARYAMDGIGLDLDKDFQGIYLEKAADGRQWSSTGAPRRCGRRRWLAGIRCGRERPGGRAFYRAERGRNQAHHDQTYVHQAADAAGKQLSGTGCAGQYRGLVGFRVDAADAARRRRVSPCTRAAQRRSHNRQAARSGARIDDGEYTRGCAAHRPAASGTQRYCARSDC